MSARLYHWVDGILATVPAHIRRLGLTISPQSVYRRLAEGRPIDQALKRPARTPAECSRLRRPVAPPPPDHPWRESIRRDMRHHPGTDADGQPPKEDGTP